MAFWKTGTFARMKRTTCGITFKTKTQNKEHAATSLHIMFDVQASVEKRVMQPCTAAVLNATRLWCLPGKQKVVWPCKFVNDAICVCHLPFWHMFLGYNCASLFYNLIIGFQLDLNLLFKQISLRLSHL